MMYEIKSKKTGRVQIVSPEELAQMDKIISRFIVTKLTLKPLTPSLKSIKTELKEVKPIKTK